MSDKNFDASLSLLLAHEGGFSNNPKDPGGPTNKGITQAVYNRYRISNKSATRSVRLIEDAEVGYIYRAEYWDDIGGDNAPAGIDYAMFDYAVNSGITQAVKDLQRTINANVNFYGVTGQLKVDGRMGLATCQAIAKAGVNAPDELIVAYCARRLAFMKSLKNWSTFGVGWQRRVEGKNVGAEDGDDGVVDLAVKMAAHPVVVMNTANPAKTPVVPLAEWGGATAVPLPEKPPVIVVTPPAAIGAHEGETPAKAFSSEVAIWRTVQGAGAALAAAGVTGNTLMDAAGTVKSHANETILGQLALVAFIVCMIAGVGLILYKFYEERVEKRSS